MKLLNKTILCLCLCGLSSGIMAEQITKQQIKGLDEQVQAIKTDVLSISTELNLLEEKLLFPSNTQISLFVSLEQQTEYQPDAIKIQLDKKNVAQHVYSFKEVEALQRGGVQRLFTGNVRTGEHKINVQVVGNHDGNNKKDNVSHSFSKGVGPQFIEIRLTGSDVEIKNW